MKALRSRWVRFPSYVLGGFAGATIGALLFQPHYLPLCDRINAQRGVQCSPVSAQAMIGFFVIGLGFITLVIVPIAASLIHLVRHGADWEMSRGTETAQTNLPILAGFIYLATGSLVALAAY